MGKKSRSKTMAMTEAPILSLSVSRQNMGSYHSSNSLTPTDGDKENVDKNSFKPSGVSQISQISQTPQLTSRKNKNERSQTMTELPTFSLNGFSSPSPRSPPSKSPITAKTPRGTTSHTASHSLLGRSDNNLQNILCRGRKPERSNGRKRARSLSGSKKDNSWMTHKHTDTASERIKTNVLKQKQLDLQGLMKSNSSKKKKDISKLFEKHIETAKVIASQGGGPQNEPNAAKLKDRLKNEEDAMENAVDIVKDLGFLKYIKNNDIYSKIYIKKGRMDNDDDDDDDDEKDEKIDFDLFDMNNMTVLKMFEGKMRETLTKVICKSIVSIPSIEIVEICNCDIDADFMEVLCKYLGEYYMKNKNSRITILSLQSNPIIDRGMIALCSLIRMNQSMLTTIKLQNNRKDISTLICQQICEALEQNEYIIKFEFEFRHYQWRDYRDKVVKRNAEKARLSRLELQKAMSV